MRGGEVGDVEAHHRLAEAARDLRDHGGVVVGGGGAHDGGRALRGLPGLEDPGADGVFVGSGRASKTNIDKKYIL